ncbi:Retrovirus-related Pol polyprotein from transposon RE1 [Cardamine amara subsp. amara]|uniref:Retrovirus-related Pol polyprotein from transposon RE1 n=1 Tax=Cardamine amara subsp. amara TaxID=228776 RepID=A0ABD0ZT75_CARAN
MPASIPDMLTGKEQTGDVILDTEASHHMMSDVSVLIEMEDILSCTINFTDGSQVFTIKCGKLPLSDKMIMENVLLVPNLNCTPLSVLKLLKQTGCYVVFTDTLCILQDYFTRTLIGAGEERDGVYVYRDVMATRVHKALASEDQALWHQRLGHPAFRVLEFLPMVFGVEKNNTQRFGGCKIYFKSKQTRAVFFDSFNKASDCFSLIHVDVCRAI